MKNGVPGPEGSLGKWQWAEINQHLMELAMEIEGPYSQFADDSEYALDRRLAVPVPAHAGELDRGRDHGHPARTSSPSGCSACPSCGNGDRRELRLT